MIDPASYARSSPPAPIFVAMTLFGGLEAEEIGTALIAKTDGDTDSPGCKKSLGLVDPLSGPLGSPLSKRTPRYSNSVENGVAWGKVSKPSKTYPASKSLR